MISLIRKSNTGSTRYIDKIMFENISSKSYAALLLLNNELLKQDEEYLESYWKKKVEFSRQHLRSVQKELGVLSCFYCPSTNLIIEEDGMKVRKDRKATIDHKVPLSKGGSFYDLKNIVVCCEKCNTRKKDRTAEEFINILQS